MHDNDLRLFGAPYSINIVHLTLQQYVQLITYLAMTLFESNTEPFIIPRLQAYAHGNGYYTYLLPVQTSIHRTKWTPFVLTHPHCGIGVP